MLAVTSPRSLLHQQTIVLSALWPGVLDADTVSVHDARVATRRIRELVPLVGADSEATEGLSQRLKTIGRGLGRVRELDVISEHLHGLAEAVPMLAAVVAPLDVLVRGRQRDARVQMINTLEKLDTRRLFADLRHYGNRWSRVVHTTHGRWKRQLRTRIAERATLTREQLESATGVYLPERSHETRIAVKKLRYAVEAASATGLWRRRRLLKALRRVQETLGDLHDTQVLLSELGHVENHGGLTAATLQPLVDTLTAAVDRHHRDYLERRNQLRAICAACIRQAQPPLQRVFRRVAESRRSPRFQ